MRELIINADDFGLSPGVNRGIAEAHCTGVVTSTSLLVDTPFSAQAAALSFGLPRLSVGLHVDLSAQLLDHGEGTALAAWTEEIARQMERFRCLRGREPTHLDSHHNVHRHPGAARAFVAAGRRYGLPVREHGRARYVSSFYGQWDGRTHLDQISVRGLELLLRHHDDPVIELGTHPGYCDAHLRSSYRHEREAELRTLCDQRVPALLEELGIVLLDSQMRRQTLGHSP